MQTEDLANADGANTATPATTAAPETEKVETPAEGAQASDATTEQGQKPETAQTEEAEAKAASEAGKQLNERRQRAKERVQEAVGRQRDAERRAQRAEAELAQLRANLKAPVADEYTDPAKLNADQIGHALDQREVQRLEARKTEAAQDAQAERMQAFRERADEFKASLEKPEEFDKAVTTLAPLVGDETTAMLADLDDGPAVIQNLAANLPEARRIDKLPTMAKAFELGKLAERLTSKPLPRVTTAPNPVTAVSGRVAGSSPDPSKMSQSEFEKWWASKK